MGTCNFHNSNSSAIFVVDYGDDDFMWQECQEHLAEAIKYYLPAFEPDDSLTSADELRSFPTSSIGYIEHSIDYLGISFQFKLSVFLRSGYYEAANLDWEPIFMLYWNDCFDTIDGIMSEIDYNPSTYDINPGLWAIHKYRLESKLNQLQVQAITELEQVLAKVSEPYGVTAQFSNGETIYYKLGADNGI